ISPERQTWHCFGTCGEGGDIIKFLMKYENLEFYDALKILAEKAGVELRVSGDRDFNSNNNLYRVMEEAKNFFKANLAQADKVKEYLKDRGLNQETIEEFEIGVAMDGSDLLTKHLIKKGFNIQDIEKAGLCLKTERGTYWDRFRARVMFPIHNHVGKVVAFTGRIMPGSESANVGKYVNSPETPIFQKSKILYGFDKTKNDIRQEHKAVMVEGQMDLLMIWQDGVKNVVATSGTALTDDHLTVLRRLADELVLSFDSDEAGQAAAERAIDMANAHDFSVKLLVVDDPKLKDPADVVKAKPGHIAELVSKAKTAMEYYFHKYMKNISDDLKIKKQIIRVVLGKIRGLASPIDRSHWLKELSHFAKISEEVLADEMAALPKTAEAEKLPAKALPEKNIPETSRQDVILQRLFGILLHLKSDLTMLNDHIKYFPDRYANAYKEFTKSEEDRSSDIAELMGKISMRFSFNNQDMEIESLEKEIGLLLRQLKLEYLKEKRQQLSDLIKQLDRSGDEKKLKEAMAEFAEISKELQGA
ncbi:MAG: DNA primase, partial [Candidatus Magasanikbacteria bacterium]|nr:DNA primase [Candidatus Magasanikbacteria bacterium]